MTDERTVASLGLGPGQFLVRVSPQTVHKFVKLIYSHVT